MRFRTLTTAILVTTALLLAACSRPDAPAATPPFTVPGTPSAVYDAILPEIRDRIARDTKIVRIDSSTSVTMRFTAYLEDHSVRLVNVELAAGPPETTTATIQSKRFSFLPRSSRDPADAALEGSLAALIVRHTSPAHPPPSVP